MATQTGNTQGQAGPPNYSQMAAANPWQPPAHVTYAGQKVPTGRPLPRAYSFLAAANPWRQAQQNPYAGGLANPAPRVQSQPGMPAWLQNLKDRWGKLNELGTPTGIGGGNAPIPNVPAWMPQAGPSGTPPPGYGPPTSPAKTSSMPAWLQNLQDRWGRLNTLGTPTGIGGGSIPAPNAPAWLQPNNTPSTTPTVSGPAGQGGTPNPVNYPRTPDKPVAPNPFAGGLANPADYLNTGFYEQVPPLADPGSNWGFGSQYSGWGRGGGGGGARYSNVPAWYLGLNSWSFNE